MINLTRIVSTFFLSIILTAPAHALYLSSSQTTNNSVEINSGNPFSFSFTVSADVTGIDGGLFDMKRGAQTSAPITFTIMDAGLPSPVFQKSLNASLFTESLKLVPFAGTYDLLAGHIYTASLTTSAPADANSDYGIRWRDILSFVDADGNPGTPPNGATLAPVNQAPTPEPVSILLIGAGMAGLAGYRCRNRKA